MELAAVILSSSYFIASLYFISSLHKLNLDFDIRYCLIFGAYDLGFLAAKVKMNLRYPFSIYEVNQLMQRQFSNFRSFP
jgi:hypothetical protein